jgi:uncharacterized membrane protein YdbT with pleckstrin-like domain
MDEEVTLYDGPVSHKTRLGTYILCAIIPVIGWLCAFVVWLRIRSTRYRITSKKVEVTRGILSKDVDSVLLWRVRDVRYHQSFGGRLLGIEDLTLSFLDDAEGGVLVIRGLPEARPLYEKLVGFVDQAGRNRRAAAS